ncbi:MAG: RDD family protein [Pelagibacterales bacterium]|nr:RDD family protein [Pelagibacterales bacterium]
MIETQKQYSSLCQYAGFWVRFFAGLLDLIFLLPIFIILVYYFGFDDFQAFQASGESFSYSSFSASEEGKSVEIIMDFLSVIYLSYFVAGKKQATLGKRIMGIYVGNLNGEKLTWKKSLCRALACLLTSATLGLGFIIVIFTKEKIALHDFICKTRVFHGKLE